MIITKKFINRFLKFINLKLCLLFLVCFTLNLSAQEVHPSFSGSEANGQRVKKIHTLYKKQFPKWSNYIWYYCDEKTKALQKIVDSKNDNNRNTSIFYFTKDTLAFAQVFFKSYVFNYYFEKGVISKVIPKKRDDVSGFKLENDSEYTKLINKKAEIINSANVLKSGNSDLDLYKKRIVDETRKVITKDSTLNRKIESIDAFVQSVDTMRFLETEIITDIALDDTESSTIVYKDKITGQQVKTEDDNEGVAYYKNNHLVYSIRLELVNDLQFVIRRYFDADKEIYKLKY